MSSFEKGAEDKTKPDKSAGRYEFDFSAWKTLYENDPLAFEQQRQQVIDELIQSAPEEYQHRLNGLMFRVNAVRSRASNPMHACLEISKLMWNSVADLRAFLEDLGYVIHSNEIIEKRSKSSAVILQFGG
ncbi:MAG: DUF3135 domain-containing protein [Kangiellaceae bacterium]|nr:DUF3135 domain-containing protein [Kangiellaceae bacterium]MCW9000049.1 DUF3135 domain-containing protein [Kangiellaceae bacterium]